MDLGFDGYATLYQLVTLVVAFLLALPVAYERESATRSLGLRTFPLVAVASCGYILVGVSLLGAQEDDHARIIAGLMTGIGFIGGGAILKHGAGVRGTATAASIWTTGAVGAAVGYGFFGLAVMISAINFLTLKCLTPLEKKVWKDGSVADEEAEGDEPR